MIPGGSIGPEAQSSWRGCLFVAILTVAFCVLFFWFWYSVTRP